MYAHAWITGRSLCLPAGAWRYPHVLWTLSTKFPSLSRNILLDNLHMLWTLPFTNGRQKQNTKRIGLTGEQPVLWLIYITLYEYGIGIAQKQTTSCLQCALLSSQYMVTYIHTIRTVGQQQIKGTLNSSTFPRTIYVKRVCLNPISSHNGSRINKTIVQERCL